MTSEKPVIIAAAEFEIEALISQFEVFICGVGPLNPCLTISRNADKFRGRSIIYVGTAGAFQEEAVLKICTAKSAYWLPTCERMGSSYAVMDGKANPPIHSFALDSRLEQKVILSSPNVSLSKSLPPEFKSTECLENLELYSVARATEKICKSLCAVIYVTNSIGPNAHIEWKANFKIAAQKTADYVRENF